jgi:hypothetical protein
MALFMSHLKPGCAKKFVAAMTTVVSSPTAQQLLEEYGVVEDMPDDEGFSRILNFINDVLFFAPVLSFAQGWAGNAYVYYFNEENPWDGPWRGRASHILDLAYLFQNYREFLTPAQQSVGTAFAEDIFKFCHGVAPWPAVAGIPDGFVARTYGPSRGQAVGQVEQPYGGGSLRRPIPFDYADKVSLDELARVVDVFKTTP